jgi:hypothetical protein
VLKPERTEAIEILEHEHGISGGQIYLLPLIPLIEMVWADGKNQEAELELVKTYMNDHIDDLNAMSDGQQVVGKNEIAAFIERFVDNPPSPQLLKTIRALADPVIFSSADPTVNEQRKLSILEFCMDIAAAAVTTYPYDQRSRFMDEEKKLFLELMNSLNSSADTSGQG